MSPGYRSAEGHDKTGEAFVEGKKPKLGGLDFGFGGSRSIGGDLLAVELANLVYI